ncbi:MAG TPA: ABC transporter substrate-binding protein [Nakamurella sp.]|nr:ABC transporter substrate-binding protein [Nakamurella sp.]
MPIVQRFRAALLPVLTVTALVLSGCSSAPVADGPSGASGLPGSSAPSGPSGSSGSGVTGASAGGSAGSTPAGPQSSTAAPASGAASGPASPDSGTGTGSASPVSGSASGSASPDSGTATGSSSPRDGIGPDGCITHFDPEADYFPDKARLEYATNFTIDYHRSYAVLTVQQPSQGAKPASYVLVRCGAPTPQLSGALAKDQQVTVPVHSLFSGSTTQLPSLVMLDRLDVLTGVAFKAFVSETPVVQHISSPDVVQYADAAGTVDAERVVAAKPDVLVTGGFDDPAYANIIKAGVPVLSDADWLENDPLGRAEWIKFFGALTDTQAAAGRQFDSIVDAYQRLQKLAAPAAKVSVVTGQPYQGTWYVPGGGSYTARLIADAGGTYPWASDPSTGSIATDVETVFARSGTAPVWLASTTWTTTKQALAENATFAKFTAFATGNVWNAAKDVNSAGGNNFYELGAARPDLILGDLVAILHPDLLPDHEFAFYLKLS